MRYTGPSLREKKFIKKKSSQFEIDFSTRRRGILELCSKLKLPEKLSETLFDIFEKPEAIYDLLARHGVSSYKFHIVGTIERRIILVENDMGGGYGVVFGSYGAEALPTSIRKELCGIEELQDCVFRFQPKSSAFFSAEIGPSIFLTSLYHPENFPLPRFSLAISDLARSARLNGATRVRMMDMQLGNTINEIVQEVVQTEPSIFGVSATFGQHDVLEQLLDTIPKRILKDMLLVFGGSLSVLNREVLLDKYPMSVVATGAGEQTIAGLIEVVAGRRSLPDVVGVAYRDHDGSTKMTARFGPRETDEMLPELDLLEQTFDKGGVVQLESSRGCSYACSFCPREHKGIWSGDDPVVFNTVIPDITRIIDRFPKIDRRVFLVDEEFVGYRAEGESEARVLSVAKRLKENRLKFETSSRADQVYRRNKDDKWHFDRIDMWRTLVEDGLDRCLFGIESGVDAVLMRFNKKTTSDQNSTAIRVLSLLGVPPRFTYITFDPLMTFDDLLATCRYQARTDLTLKHSPNLSHQEVLHISTNNASAALYSDGRPFYEQISYMLVSIECLKDAPYTKAVQEFGLLHEFNANMGRYDSSYLDPEIGLFSEYSQRWIDRTFSLDYLLKSIEKYVSGDEKTKIRSLRVVIKQFAFELLRCFVSLRDTNAVSDLHRSSAYLEATSYEIREFQKGIESNSREILTVVMDRHFENMKKIMAVEIASASEGLNLEDRKRINVQFQDWAMRSSWHLINAA